MPPAGKGGDPLCNPHLWAVFLPLTPVPGHTKVRLSRGRGLVLGAKIITTNGGSKGGHPPWPPEALQQECLSLRNVAFFWPLSRMWLDFKDKYTIK